MLRCIAEAYHIDILSGSPLKHKTTLNQQYLLNRNHQCFAVSLKLANYIAPAGPMQYQQLMRLSYIERDCGFDISLPTLLQGFNINMWGSAEVRLGTLCQSRSQWRIL